MPLKTENWDGVVAPAIPAGWNVGTVFTTTSTFVSSIVPTSSPNALKLTPASNADFYATWGTADGVGGAVVVKANFNVATIPTHCIIGLTARGSAATLNSTTTTQYRAYLDLAAGAAIIDRMVAGTPTQSANLGFGPVAALTWYQLTFTANGSALSLAAQRLSDNFWLNSSGVWAAPVATAIVTSNATITGSGFAGIYAVQTAAGSHPQYSDDWSLSSATSDPGVGSILLNALIPSGIGQLTDLAHGAILLGPELVSGVGAATQVGLPYITKPKSRPLLPIHIAGAYD